MPRFLILAAAVALVAAACGGATEADSAAPASTQAPVTSTTAIVADDDHAEDESGDDHDNGGSTETPDRTVEVLMTEFSFDVDPFEVVAGETIEFVVTNTGVVPHEFRVSNQERVDEHLDAGHDDHDDSDGAAGESEEVADYVLVLDAGDTASIVVTFPQDQALFTNVVCLLPGHYEAGMSADVEYTA